MKSIKIREMMTKHVRCMKPSESVSAAYELMLLHDLRHIPVVDHTNKLVGIISDRDILVDASRDLENRVHPAEVLIKDIMSKEPLTCTADQPMHKAIELMLERKINSIPVVNNQKNVIGLITSTDVMRLIFDFDFTAKDRVKLIDAFQQSSPDWQPVDSEEYG